jgi:hypothetical protein
LKTKVTSFLVLVLTMGFLLPPAWQWYVGGEFQRVVATLEESDDARVLQKLKNLSVNALSRDRRMTPLIHAVLNNDERAMRLLLAAGADPDITTRVGWNARDIAEKMGRKGYLESKP